MQSYSNHKRYYTAHHFVFYPVIVAAAIFCFILGFIESSLLWATAGLLFLTAGWLSFMLRQHYALMLQNRLILLEMKVRYMEAGMNFGAIQHQLSNSQLFALRFAPDEELKNLTERAIQEKLSADEIKKSIGNWKGDYLRV